MKASRLLSVLLALIECFIFILGRPHTKTFTLRRERSGQGRWQSNPEYEDGVRVEQLKVESRVMYRYAHTLVTSRMANTHNSSQQIKFSVLLPEAAFITGFTLEAGGKEYKAFVKEKQRAKLQYQQAVDSGLTAGHLAVSARDSNHFFVSVNVEAGRRVSFNLTYEQLLSRKLGLYNHVINLNPGQIVTDLSVNVEVLEPQPISRLSVLPFSSSSQVTAISHDQIWEEVEVVRKGVGGVIMHWSPSPEKQQQLSLGAGEGLSGQLVLRYDVDNQLPGGSILVNEGYFVHVVTPSDLPPLRKHAIFTLDVSGSMMGRKLDQLKDAMTRILDDLDPSDYFTIIEFSYSVTVWNLDELSSSAVFQPELHPSSLWWFNKAEFPTTSLPSTTPSPPPPTVPPYPATAEYIRKAKEVISKMTAGGGTNIHGALKTAVLAASASLINTTNSATPKPEPLVIFLTDGDPTIGITDTNKILNMVKELNVKQSAIFSLAFGDGADLSFLRRLSAANNGFARNIYEAADAALQLRDFYHEVASPLLANVTFSYPPGVVVRSSLTTQNFHTLFLGSQIIVAGRLDKTDQVSGSVTGLTAHGSTTYHTQTSTPAIDELSADLYAITSAETEESSETGVREEKRRKKKKTRGTLERLWAYLTIQQLLEKRQVAETGDVNKRVLELALKYSFVTPMTSLVVIKPDDSVEIDQESLRPQTMRNRLYAEKLFKKPRPSPTKIKIEGTSSFMEDSATKHKVYSMEQLKKLTIDDIRWIDGLVDRENATIILPLGVNGTNQQYRLGINQSREMSEIECSSVLMASKPSHCVHLPHCVLPEILTSVSNYIRFYCPLPQGFAGICCPDNWLSTTSRVETTTGDTADYTTTDPPTTTPL